MPRENRKRGKKHKKQKDEDEYNGYQEKSYEEEVEEPQAGPSWIHPRTNAEEEDSEFNPEAPFGLVNPDVKAYFKTVDERLREWQDVREDGFGNEEEGEDISEERRLFLVAALDEMSGNEKQLATDAECSNVLERMTFSMGDFVKRVFADRLAGSYMALSKHRFGSHVVQTLISSARPTVGRETKGIFPPSIDGDNESGSLPTMTNLILSICNELIQDLPSLIIDPFASHVLRALFVLICPYLRDEDASKPSILRSKKSAKHRAKQGPLKSVFTETTDSSPGDAGNSQTSVPKEFTDMSESFIRTVKDSMTANEVRALAADNVGCPVLVLLLEIEAAQGSANDSDSLMDRVSHGLISATLSGENESSESSDYVTTLLREPVASHLLERIVSLCPQAAFPSLWKLYFQGKLNKIAVHPVANFPLARAIERLDEAQLQDALTEMEGTWSKLLKSSRLGVLRACIERAASLGRSGDSICQVVRDVFSIQQKEKSQLIPCVLYLKTWEEYQSSSRPSNADTPAEGRSNYHKNEDVLEPTVQGSTLLQSLLRLPEPHNSLVIDSITSTPVTELINLSRNAISSRVLDELLDSNTVPSRAKRKFLLSLIGQYHELADDRIGSRVADRCWASADPYLKEKIARSLFAQERFLLSSQYGRYFGRKLQLHLLKRDPERWKASQSQAGSAPKTDAVQALPQAPPAPNDGPGSIPQEKEKKKKKRKRDVDNPNEIDVLFASLGKKSKVGSLGVSQSISQQKVEVDRGLKDV
ncbi:ARM repeat-containing protein [Schizopora paradoxa]|uniref:Nucleolar protein 9 n=1 Tax=Schizopora paradoxa TaxID=27342 RepID=A0A0H2RUT0_9AGAM|nr:ARM repeat-containing protein [Schizopora paradoxa]